MDADPAERVPVEAAPAEPPDSDAGVPAPPRAPTATEAAPLDEAAELAAGGTPPRRPVKLVVSLQPGGAMGYRAVLALGTDGCDPLLRTADVPDLAGALDEVPGLLAEAEGRWQRQPRYPAAAPAKTRPAAPSRAPTSRQGPPRLDAPTTPPEPPRAPTPSHPPAPTASPADQLALFG